MFVEIIIQYGTKSTYLVIFIQCWRKKAKGHSRKKEYMKFLIEKSKDSTCYFSVKALLLIKQYFQKFEGNTPLYMYQL